MPTAPQLFVPLALRDLTVRNRVWVPPMCMYSARDGFVDDFHLMHYGELAAGGFGLVMAEATAVEPAGRITPRDAGLWSDDHIGPWRRVVDLAHSFGASIGVQLAHAGRKASTYWPGAPSAGSVAADDGGWQTIGASGEAFPGYAAPRAATEADLDRVVAAFVAAARRAEAAGFDTVQIHAAHGYLLHEFLSPLTNLRTDAYGGSSEGRRALALRVVAAVREVWPADRPVSVRVSATDHLPGGLETADTIEFAVQLRELGVDLVDVSTGELLPAPVVPYPGYRVPFAAAVRAGAAIPTAAVSLISEPTHAEYVVACGAADAVNIGRAALRDPHWALRAAHELGVPRDEAPWPLQYRRGAWRR